MFGLECFFGGVRGGSGCNLIILKDTQQYWICLVRKTLLGQDESSYENTGNTAFFHVVHAPLEVTLRKLVVSTENSHTQNLVLMSCQKTCCHIQAEPLCSRLQNKGVWVLLCINIVLFLSECLPNGTVVITAVKLLGVADLDTSLLVLRDRRCKPNLVTEKTATFKFHVNTCGTSRKVEQEGSLVIWSLLALEQDYC